MQKSVRANIRLFYIYAFFAGIYFMVPIWVAFERKFLSFSEMALLEALGTIILVVFQLPTGALADLIGRKNTMILGWIFAGAGWTLMGFSKEFPQFVAAYSVSNLGVSLYQGADTALLYDSLKQIGEQNMFQKICAKKSIIIQSSLAFSTFLGGYLFAIWNSLPYVLTSLASLPLIYFLIQMKEPDIDSEKFTFKTYLKKNMQGFSEIVKNSRVKSLCIFYILVGGITWSAQIFFNQTLATEVGTTAIERSWFFGGMRIINALLIYKLISLGLINKKRAFLFFPLIMMLAFLPGIFAGKFSGLLITGLAMFIATARFTVLDKYLNDEFDSKSRASAISTLAMFVSGIYILLMLLSGPIIEQTSNRFMFSILGVLTIIFVLPLGIKLWKEQSVNSQTPPNPLNSLNIPPNIPV